MARNWKLPPRADLTEEEREAVRRKDRDWHANKTAKQKAARREYQRAYYANMSDDQKASKAKQRKLARMEQREGESEFDHSIRLAIYHA